MKVACCPLGAHHRNVVCPPSMRLSWQAATSCSAKIVVYPGCEVRECNRHRRVVRSENMPSAEVLPSG